MLSRCSAGWDARTWRAVEGTVVSLLTKITGSGLASLSAVLEERGSIAGAVQRTRSLDPVQRAAAAELLGAAHRAEHTDAVLRLLQDRDPDVRQVAARALGRIGRPDSAGALLSCVQGSRSVPVRVVTRSLALLGPDAAPALAGALDDESPLVRAVAADMLGLTGAVRACPALVRHLRTDTTEVRIRCARALGRIGAQAALEPLLEAVGGEQPTPLRAVAVRALGDLGAVQAVPRLRSALSDASPRVAHNAAEALARMGGPGLRVLMDAEAGDVGPAAAPHAAEVLAMARLRGLLVPDEREGLVTPGTPGAPGAPRVPAPAPPTGSLTEPSR